MPLFKKWELGETGVAAIWKIEEPEDFFRQRTGYTSEIKSNQRRIEHIGGRFLLQFLQPEFPIHQIAKDEHDKPRLANNRFYFSVSHSYPFIAAVIDTHREAGIDIQTWHGSIKNIVHKFLSKGEQELIGEDEMMLTLAWCAKESVYKWNGRRAVEFIEQLPITHFGNAPEFNINILLQSNNSMQNVFLKSIINTDFACSYVVETQLRLK